MSVNSKMTAIADKIRGIQGTTGTMGLDAMATNLGTVQTNITSAFTAVGNKGGTVPPSKVSGNLASAINTIPDGVELNFQVVGGTAQPSSPTTNTIWVNTNTNITSWVFSATQPTGSSGMVWISTATKSNATFNALKANDIQVYPLSVKQYVSGAWVGKKASIYQNGGWVNLGIEIILENGVLNSKYGEWTPTGKTATTSFSGGIIQATLNTNNGNSGYLSAPITISGQSKLCFRAKVTAVYGLIEGYYYTFSFGLAKAPLKNYASFVDKVNALDAKTTINAPNGGYLDYEVDLSGLPDGDYYVSLAAIATYEIDYIALEA